MLIYQNKNIVLIDDENKNYFYINEAIAIAFKTQSNCSFNSFHIKNETQLSALNADVVFVSSNWIFEHDKKWFYHFFDNNNRTKFVILINHCQGHYINKIVSILHTLPLESQICFIPIDNYSHSIIVQCMINHIIINN